MPQATRVRLQWLLAAQEEADGAARLSNDLGAVASGKPSRMARRGKNKLLGRVFARLKAWRLLWGK
jgi:hypothetical protein